MLRPVFDLIYIIPIEPQADKESLIQIPETYDRILPQDDGSKIVIPQYTERRINQGIVKYRGPLTTDEIKVGDHVIFDPLEGAEIVADGEGRIIVIAEDHILAILPDEEYNVLHTTDQVKRAVRRVGRDLAQHYGMEYDETRQKITFEITERVLDRIDSYLAEELYF